MNKQIWEVVQMLRQYDDLTTEEKIVCLQMAIRMLESIKAQLGG